jgi:hypothetical protein
MHDGQEVFIVDNRTSAPVFVGEIAFQTFGHGSGIHSAAIRVSNPELVRVETPDSKKATLSILDPELLSKMFYTHPPIGDHATLVLPTLPAAKVDFIPLTPYMDRISRLLHPQRRMLLSFAQPTADPLPLPCTSVLIGQILTTHLDSIVEGLEAPAAFPFPDLPWTKLVLSAAQKRALLETHTPFFVPGPIPFACGTTEHVHFLGVPCFVDINPPQPSCAQCQGIGGFSTDRKVRVSVVGLQRCIGQWFDGRVGFRRFLAAAADPEACIFHTTTLARLPISRLLQAATPDRLRAVHAMLHHTHKLFVSSIFARKIQPGAELPRVIVLERDGAALDCLERIRSYVARIRAVYNLAATMARESNEAAATEAAATASVRFELMRLAMTEGARTIAIDDHRAPHQCPLCDRRGKPCTVCEVDFCVKCGRFVFPLEPADTAGGEAGGAAGAGAADTAGAGAGGAAGGEAGGEAGGGRVCGSHSPSVINFWAAHPGPNESCCSMCKDCPNTEAALVERRSWQGMPEEGGEELSYEL